MEFDIEKLAGFDGPGRPKSWYTKHTKFTDYHGVCTLVSPKSFGHERYHPLLGQEETLRYLIEFLELDLKEVKMNDEHIRTQNGHSMIQEFFKLRRFFRELLVYPVGTSFGKKATRISEAWLDIIAKRTGWLEKRVVTYKEPMWGLSLFYELTVGQIPERTATKTMWFSTKKILTKCDWNVRRLIHEELSLKFKLPKDICNLICQYLGYP